MSSTPLLRAVVRSAPTSPMKAFYHFLYWQASEPVIGTGMNQLTTRIKRGKVMVDRLGA